jgi:hypothetical protein
MVTGFSTTHGEGVLLIFPDEADTHDTETKSRKDRTNIFFINMYYTTIIGTFYRLSFIVKAFSRKKLIKSYK